ncbi:hypothetical protein [Amycolatopsis pithecellobii]|uniref:hypothetical protein n=1 Tax=Amycolatopsis pithecellobii TaxID=664692 RepID=UPI001409302E|nr:hypothetical protein [Amycolatopsis pithecellobii]
MRGVAIGLVLVALTLGCAGCRDNATPSSPRPQDELSQIQTTLDAIDSEVAGDGSP